MTIDTILLPTDFSEPSQRAADEAAGLARQLGARLHVMHAYERAGVITPDGAFQEIAPNAAVVDEERQRQLDAVVGSLPADLDSTGHLVVGPAAEEILRCAESLHADLIVMGTHGRTGLRRLAVGSVTESVMRRSTVPILAVPAAP